MRSVVVYRLPAFQPDGTGWRITSAGAVMWGDRLMVLWPGYRTDLASVPRWLRPLVDDDEQGLRTASALHDIAYSGEICFAAHGFSRKEADAMLRDVAMARGLPKWKAWLVWSAVRLFGWRYWRNA